MSPSTPPRKRFLASHSPLNPPAGSSHLGWALLLALGAQVVPGCGEGAPQASGPFEHLSGMGVDTLDEDVLLIPRPDLLPRMAPENLSGSLNPVREGMVYDPISYLARRRNHTVRVNWPEHPAGKYLRQTNHFGMREDSNPSEVRPDLRVLVTGDSHTDGVVSNSESFANRLESSLAEAEPERTIEVLNAGCGYYTFPNYLGTLVKFLALEPHAFVVCVYGGNDFGVLPSILSDFYGLEEPPAPPNYRENLLAGQQVQVRGRSGAESIAQGFNQLAFLAGYPEQREVCLSSALEYTAAMAELCDQRGIRFILVYLPPPFDAQPKIFAKMHDQVAAAIGLSAEELQATDRLANDFLEGLADLPVEVVDARDALREPGQSTYYWLRDEHLNDRGHERIAELLEPLFR